MASQRTLEATPEGPGTMRTTLEPVRLLHPRVLRKQDTSVFAWRPLWSHRFSAAGATFRFVFELSQVQITEPVVPGITLC